MPAKLVTVRDIAEMFDITEQAVRKQLVGLEPDEKVGRKAARYAMRRYVEHVHVGRSGEALDLNAERARLAKAQADKQEMDNALRRGELAPMQWYEGQLDRFTRQVAAMLDLVPLRLRQVLPHLTHIDHARIDRTLANERERLADRLAGGPEAGEGGGGPGGEPAAETETAAAQ